MLFVFSLSTLSLTLDTAGPELLDTTPRVRGLVLRANLFPPVIRSTSPSARCVDNIVYNGQLIYLGELLIWTTVTPDSVVSQSQHRRKHIDVPPRDTSKLTCLPKVYTPTVVLQGCLS